MRNYPLLPALLLLLTASNADARNHTWSYFSCTIVDRGTFGSIKMKFTTDDAGKIEKPSSLIWTAPRKSQENATVSASWTVGRDNLNLKDGIVTLTPPEWTELATDSNSLALELASSLTPSPPLSLAGVDNMDTLDIAWNRIAIGEPLYLVARHRQGYVVEHSPIDPLIFEGARPHIEMALIMAKEMVRDPKPYCAYHPFEIFVG